MSATTVLAKLFPFTLLWLFSLTASAAIVWFFGSGSDSITVTASTASLSRVASTSCWALSICLFFSSSCSFAFSSIGFSWSNAKESARALSWPAWKAVLNSAADLENSASWPITSRFCLANNSSDLAIPSKKNLALSSRSLFCFSNSSTRPVSINS